MPIDQLLSIFVGIILAIVTFYFIRKKLIFIDIDNKVFANASPAIMFGKGCISCNKL